MLFKFLNPDRIDVLENLKIRFSQPSVLNDPFESRALLDIRQDIGQMMDEYEEKFRIVVEENRDDPTRVDNIEAFNDAVKEVREHARRTFSHANMGREILKYLNKAQGILSLSRANDNLLMWAHYGKSHEGYVLGLDEDHEFFNSKNMQGEITRPRNVVYSSRKFVIDTTSDAYQERVLTQKSTEWAYEEEVRVFRNFRGVENGFIDNTEKQVHLFSLPATCIKEIYIGANASVELKNRIMVCISRHRLHVRLFHGVIPDDKYEINFQENFDRIINYAPTSSAMKFNYGETPLKNTVLSRIKDIYRR